MSFDLVRIQREVAERPLLQAAPLDLAVAIVNDTLRMAGAVVVVDEAWAEWERSAKPLWAEQLGVVGVLLAQTSLRAATVEAIRGRAVKPAVCLRAFFEAIEPLTAELVRTNVFRREELLRRWIEAWGGEVAGEAPEQSALRLGQLDYRAALRELDRADKARKAEADRRARLLREAQEREAAARGWRE
ncbi:MAG: hypothetical protein AMXMBFR64_60200 [Myxococcales bacterium]